MIRNATAAWGAQWERIIMAPASAECFNAGGTALKQAAQSYDPNPPQAAYFKKRSRYLEYPATDRQIAQAGFIDFAVSIFAQLKDFNGFLNRALADFQMPKRQLALRIAVEARF